MKKSQETKHKKQGSVEWEVTKKLAGLFFSVISISMPISGFATYYLISIYFNLHWTIGVVLGFAMYYVAGMIAFPELRKLCKEDIELQKYA